MIRTPSASSIVRSADRAAPPRRRARSLPTAAQASSARCHRSWWPVSATETFARRSAFTSGFSTLPLVLERLAALEVQLPGHHGRRPPTYAAPASADACSVRLTSSTRNDSITVADLEVVEVLDADAALEALADLLDVVLEALEARQRAGRRPSTPSRITRAFAGALDDAAADHAAGDRARPCDLEELRAPRPRPGRSPSPRA